MRVFLREGERIKRQDWKQSLVAMRLAQMEDGEAVKEALRD